MLVYDWSQEGDVEVVIEDIENTELDMIECYSNQQKDWRFGDEINAATARYQCTNRYWVRKKLNCFGLERATFSNILIPPMEQLIEMEEIFRHVSSERFAPGANQHLGDDVLMMKLFGIHNSYKSLMNWSGNRYVKGSWLIEFLSLWKSTFPKRIYVKLGMKIFLGFFYLTQNIDDLEKF